MFFEALARFADLYVILMIFVGVTVGIIGGALPGISPSMTIALLLPMTLYMPTSYAISILMGAYQGAMLGGSISAILINTPGTASAAATVLDGYPMKVNGQGLKALHMALYSSVTGGLVGTVILIISANQLARVALMFGPPEYFALMLLSLTLIAGIAGKSLLKGLLVGGFGLLLAFVGLDPIYGTTRFTFRMIELSDGIHNLALFIGAFAISELLSQLSNKSLKGELVAETDLGKKNGLTWKEYVSQLPNMTISGIIGALIGILPGIGGSTASFMAYASAQKRSKTPEKFGTGIIDGVAAAEASNNGVCGGALVPLLSLGIPGDVVTAILVGALIAHGIKPGPLLFVENMYDVYTIFIGMLLAVFVLAIVGTVGNPLFIKIVSIRQSILFPCVFLICFVGTYAARNDYFSCYLMLIFGVLAFLLRKNGYTLSPMIIAFVIGGQVESNFRRSLILDPSGMIFFQRPLCVFLLFSAVVLVFFMVRSNMKNTATK